MYAAANRILGRLVKVTPSSKVVGDLALHLVAVGRRPGGVRAEHPAQFDIPDSVIGFLSGELGDPPGGWPEPFRTKALAGPHRCRRRDAELTEDDRRGPDAADRRRHAEPAALPRARPGSSPTPARRYGDMSVLATVDYLYGLRPGEEHVVELERGRAAAARAARRSASPTSAACAR